MGSTHTSDVITGTPDMECVWLGTSGPFYTEVLSAFKSTVASSAAISEVEILKLIMAHPAPMEWAALNALDDCLKCEQRRRRH